MQASSDAVRDKSPQPSATPLDKAGLLRSQTVASSDAVYDQSPQPSATPLVKGGEDAERLRGD
jgi:hypothetical protein